jgi:hypothetical protein
LRAQITEIEGSRHEGEYARRVLADGDHVMLHSEYNLFGGEKIGFDVFRFENGKIVEHWDNLQPKPEAKDPSARSMTDGPTEIQDRDKTAANRALVQNLINDILDSLWRPIHSNAHESERL